MDIIKDKNSKITFVGISLSGVSTMESAVAVLDSHLKIIMLDKLFSMTDVKYFLDNFAGLKNAVVLVSVPDNETMIGSKWKYNSRTYDIVNMEEKIQNRDEWANRFSTRGSDYFKELSDKGIELYRFDIDNLKKAFNNGFAYRERTPLDCKALQDTLRIEFDMRELPVNMLPVAQLEALLGAYFAHAIVTDNGNFLPKVIGEFQNLPILGV